MIACLPQWTEGVVKDPGLALFALARPRLPPIPTGGVVLEIGAHDTDWSAQCVAADPSLVVFAHDWRPILMPLPNVVIQQGDILSQDCADASLDAVVSLSAIEHIGLGHYGDPVAPDGDIRVVQAIRRWLKPGGWAYWDVPYTASGYVVSTTEYRGYDAAALADRFGADVQILGYTTTYVDGWIDRPTETPTTGRAYHYVALLLQKAGHG